MIAKILDTQTGQTWEINQKSSVFAVGNWSCDCNRAPWANGVAYCGTNADGDDVCLGPNRFLVIATEYEPGERFYTLEELNADYPKELLEAHIPKPK